MALISEGGLLAEGLHGRRRAAAAEQRRGPVVGVVQLVVVGLQRGVDAAALLVGAHQRAGGAVQPARHAAQHRHLLARLRRLVHAPDVLRDVHHAVEVVRLGAQVARVEQEPSATNKL